MHVSYILIGLAVVCRGDNATCAGVTCGANGQAQVQESQCGCVCYSGFSGDSCETNLCANVTCGVNGQAQVQESQCGCVCNSGYSGDSCEASNGDTENEGNVPDTCNGDFSCLISDPAKETSVTAEPVKVTVNDILTWLCLVLVLILFFLHFRKTGDEDDDGYYY